MRELAVASLIDALSTFAHQKSSRYPALFVLHQQQCRAASLSQVLWKGISPRGVHVTYRSHRFHLTRTELTLGLIGNNSNQSVIFITSLYSHLHTVLLYTIWDCCQVFSEK